MNESNQIVSAITGLRMTVGVKLTGTNGEYTIDNGNPIVAEKAQGLWAKYVNTGNISDYSSLLNVEESERLSKLQSAIIEYQNINVPGVITGSMTWEDYVKGLESLDPESIVPVLQKYVDLAKAE